MIPGGKTPIVPAAELQSIGFAAVVWPNAFTYAYAKIATELAKELLSTGSTASFDERMIKFDEFNELVGLPKIRETEERYYSRSSKTRTSEGPEASSNRFERCDDGLPLFSMFSPACTTSALTTSLECRGIMLSPSMTRS